MLGSVPADDPLPPARPLLVWLGASVAIVVIVIGVAAFSYQRGLDEPRPVGSPAASVAGPPGTLAPWPIDTGFAADMIDHHDQAVLMSLLAIGKAESPAVRQLAVEIATAQRREGGMLTQFLRDRGIEQVDTQRSVMTWMNEPTPHDRMPGLATTQEILELTKADGPETDRLFVRLMLRHHEGGVHMATFAAAHAESPAMRDLAAKMVVDQNHEISDLTALAPPG